MLFNIQNMCERRIEIILERFEVKIDGNSCKNRSMLHIGGVWKVSMMNFQVKLFEIINGIFKDLLIKSKLNQSLKYRLIWAYL